MTSYSLEDVPEPEGGELFDHDDAPEPAPKHWRAWFIPNVPGPAFTVETETLAEAREADRILTDYSLFLGDDLIASSAGGVQKWEPALDDWYDLDGDEEEEPAVVVTVHGLAEERVERKRALRLLLAEHGFDDVDVR